MSEQNHPKGSPRKSASGAGEKQGKADKDECPIEVIPQTEPTTPIKVVVIPPTDNQ